MITRRHVPQMNGFASQIGARPCIEEMGGFMKTQLRGSGVAQTDLHRRTTGYPDPILETQQVMDIHGPEDGFATMHSAQNGTKSCTGLRSVTRSMPVS